MRHRPIPWRCWRSVPADHRTTFSNTVLLIGLSSRQPWGAQLRAICPGCGWITDIFLWKKDCVAVRTLFTERQQGDVPNGLRPIRGKADGGLEGGMAAPVLEAGRHAAGW